MHAVTSVAMPAENCSSFARKSKLTNSMVFIITANKCSSSKSYAALRDTRLSGELGNTGKLETRKSLGNIQ